MLLPPSARLDRIISPVPSSSDSQRRPPDDVVSCEASTTDDDDQPTVVYNRAIFDVVVRRRSLVAALICVFSFLSPIAMVSIPRPSAVNVEGGPLYPTSDAGYDCDEDCEFAVFSLSVRLIVIAIIFLGCCSRRIWSAAELPRFEDVEAALTAVILLIAVVFWSFYGVRIARRDVHADYARTVSFAVSMADALLFVHGLAALVLALRCRSTSVNLVVHVVRSTDGRSTTFSVPTMSVQQLALLCLRRCCAEFNVESDKSGLRVLTKFI